MWRTALLCMLLPLGVLRGARASETPPRTPWTVDDVVLSEEAAAFQISPDGRWVVWVRKTPDKEKNTRVGRLVLTGLTETKEIPLTRGSESCLSPQWSPDGQTIAFLTTREAPANKVARDEAVAQVWLMNPFGGEPWPLTRRPGGIQKFAWSSPETIVFSAKEEPPKDAEAAEEGDTTSVVDDEEHEPPVRLFEVSLKTKELRSLTDNKDRITEFALAPHGRRAVTFHERSLRFDYDNRIKPVSYLYDLKTGERQQIFRAPQFNLTQVRWGRDGKGFYAANAFTTDPRYVMATVTELHYYDLASSSIVKVDLDWDAGLASQWENDEAAGFQVTADGFVALLANGVRNVAVRYTRQGDVWRRARLLGEHVEHVFAIEVSRDDRTLVYASSTARTPTQWYRARLTGDRLGEPVPLMRLNEHLATKARARTEVIRWKGARDEEVEGLLYYPHEYQAGTKYPLVVVLHGGPALVDYDAWYESASHPQNLLAARGAFVFRPNYHGSCNYGLKWAESIAGKYLELEPQDVEKGVDALIARGLVDPQRLGLMGLSNGAILAAWLTTQTPRYRAASVMAGTVEQASDWAATKYGAAFDEYYLGQSPLRDPELYRRKSSFYAMEKVRTPTLIFAGTEDRIVSPDQARCHFRALQQTGKVPVRLLLFPGAGHELEQLPHLRRKLREDLAWFDQYLFVAERKEK